MPRENVEIVRRAYEEFNRTGQFDWEFLDPDCEFDPSGVLPDVGVFKGTEALRDLLRQWGEAYEDFRIEAERVIDAGNDRVVAFVRDGGHLRGGEEISNQFTHVWDLRNGKAVRWRTYTDRAQALEAAGLSKHDASS